MGVGAVTAGAYPGSVNTTAKGVAYGLPAMALLAEQVDALKGGDPLAAVTVVVPSNYAAVAARRFLAARPGGVANVSFLTLHRLAERLGRNRLAGAERLPVSMPVIAAAVRAVLAEAPGVFAAVADHPATERALVAAHRELRAVPADALDTVAACSPRAGDVVRIHRTVAEHLAGDWYDEHDLLVAATEVAAPEGAVIVHLLHELSPAGADFLRALEPQHVNMPVTGDIDADRAVIDAHARAGIEVDLHDVTPACAAHIVSASDPDDEVRAAVRLVTGWMREGVNLGRVALLYAMPEPYARLLHEQLTAAAIPWNGAPVRNVGDLLFGRILRALLALPDGIYRRADVLGVLTGAPLLDGDRRVPGRAWERISREAGVVAGDDWCDRLANLSARLRRKANGLEVDDPDDWRIRRSRRDADAADALALFVARLRADLDAHRSADSWSALVGWACGLVDTYLGDDRRRLRWPEEEQVAAQRVEAALERLAGLDALDGPAPTLDVFRRALDGELDFAVRRVGRLGEGVLTGHLSMAAGLVLDKVLVLGMAEGVFPPRRLEDSLLPDAERALAGGTLELRADRVHHDRRHLLAAVAAAGEAVLCQPRGDLRRSGERPASRWLVADAQVLSGESTLRSDELFARRHEPWLDHVASFTAGLRQLEQPATAQDLRLAAIARSHLDHPALADPALVRAREVVRARRSDAFTRFDGNLASIAGELSRPPRASASRLQTWATCPHRYLLQYILGVEPVSEPEKLFELSALDKGSMIHEILETFVADAIADGHLLDAWTTVDQAQLLTIAESVFASYAADGRTGRTLFWERDHTAIVSDLVRFLEKDNERLATGLRPIHTELSFGGVPLDLPSGHQLLLGGAVDRIDRAPDGSLVVLDYKTGGVYDEDKALCEEAPHANGKRLQLFLYALAARHVIDPDATVRSEYWFNTSKGKYKRIGYDVTPEVEAGVTAVVDTIVEGIAAGIFPAHPDAPTGWSFGYQCDYCSPDGGSVAERYREWERKRLDPAMARYLDLVEPEVNDV